MHSKIFQISDKPKFESSDAFSIPEWFEAEIADYAELVEDEDKALNLQWEFLENLKNHCGMKTDDNLLSFTVDKNSIIRYFHPKFTEFMHIISIINRDVDLSNFTGESLVECDLYDAGKKSKYNIEEILYSMNSEFNNKYSIYIFQSEYDYLLTLDQYMRELMYEFRSFGGKDKTLYIGSVYDYHY